MTQADRVLSTPRTDSSLNQPMFPPVADAPDSIIHQCPPGDRPDRTPPGDSPKAAGNVLQFPTLAEAEAWLQSQGFNLVPGTCNWINDTGDDAGCYSIEKGWRVEINRPTPKLAGRLSRRGILGALAVLPAVTVPAIATAKPAAWPSVSDAFRDAATALKAAKAALETVRADVARLEAPCEAWLKANPEPTDWRARKKWNRKYNAVWMPPALRDAWDRHYEAEKAFEAAQVALAEIPATNRSELLLKAALGVLYDGIALNGGRTAIISFTVSRDLAMLADTRGLL